MATLELILFFQLLLLLVVQVVEALDLLAMDFQAVQVVAQAVLLVETLLAVQVTLLQHLHHKVTMVVEQHLLHQQLVAQAVVEQAQ
jgi:hypothetical protein